MGVRLIITERQLEIIKRLNEDNVHSSLVERLVRDLNANYEPMIGVVRKEGEYHEEPMIKIKIDNSSTTPKELFLYLKAKYKIGSEFIKQVIKDWMFGKIEDNKLSKNVPLS